MKTRIPLRPPFLTLALGVLLFGASGAFFTARAQSNDRGLILNGVLELGPGGADVFYAALAILSFAFVALAAVSIARLARAKNLELVISSKSITLPEMRLGRARREAVRVPFEEVRAIRASSEWLVIDTRRGPRTVSARWLPREWPISRVAETLVSRWRAAQES